MTKLIRDAKCKVLVDGIQYHRLDESWFAQELFVADWGVDEDRIVLVSKSPLSHVVHDLNIEREPAVAFIDSETVKVFAKLPRAFKIRHLQPGLGCHARG